MSGGVQSRLCGSKVADVDPSRNLCVNPVFLRCFFRVIGRVGPGICLLIPKSTHKIGRHHCDRLVWIPTVISESNFWMPQVHDVVMQVED